MTDFTLLLTSLLLVLALGVSYKEQLALEREWLWGAVRATAQLLAVGFVLQQLFAAEQPLFTTLMLALMCGNAAWVAAKRGQGINGAIWIAFAAIAGSLTVTLSILLACGAIQYVPAQAIPVSGMVVGNAMVATGLLFRQLLAGVRERRAEIEAKLCLGAPPAEAIRSLRRDCLRTAVQPTLDSLKTLGIVQLPGMMTGLILAGASPELAVKYQIMVAFMLAGTVSISTWLAAHLACRRFFNAAEQLDN